MHEYVLRGRANNECAVSGSWPPRYSSTASLAAHSKVPEVYHLADVVYLPLSAGNCPFATPIVRNRRGGSTLSTVSRLKGSVGDYSRISRRCSGKKRLFVHT